MIIASNIMLAIAILSAFCGVASALMIVRALEKRDVRINWLWFRILLVTKYLGQYRDITRQETGRIGPLFYAYAIAMSVALVTALVGLALRAGS